MDATETLRRRLGEGLVIPACPLALNAQKKIDERRQRALLRYYLAAGAGGVAVAVHTTQFAIRDPRIGLFHPVLELAAEALGCRNKGGAAAEAGPVAIGGICGPTGQARAEAGLLRELGFFAGLLSLAALPEATEAELIRHAREIAEIIPLVGFYLQPAAGGRPLAHTFWRRFAEIENVVAIKIAPFNRYQTLEVVRAVVESGREDIALYTGNDDNIVSDLVTPFRFDVQGQRVERRVVGGLLGQWAVWTQAAVALHAECRRISKLNAAVPAELLRLGAELTDANAAIFDAAHNFAGCIPGILEIPRRNGLLEAIRCLNENERLSPGQSEEIDRVCRAYPHLTDDDFVAEHREAWLK